MTDEAFRSRAHLTTEAANPRTADLDRLPLAEALARIQEEEARLVDALAEARPAIVAAVELVAERLARGGRLVYVGAGTSGRLGVLDAVECPPTFQSDPEQVQGLLAGGREAMFRSSERAEDDAAAAPRELARLELASRDVVFGITAGGTTPYVHGAVAYAAEVGAGSVFLACVPFEQAPDTAEVSIRVPTGPEVVQGSTRLKAGTATKQVLNSVSTLVMLRLGKVWRNRMVDVDTSGNDKLLDRGLRLVEECCGLGREAARELLEAAGGQVKTAILMRSAGLDREEAERRLAACGGHLGRALEPRE